MKYVRLVLTLLVVSGLVAGTVFASSGASRKAGTTSALPNGDPDQVGVKAAPLTKASQESVDQEAIDQARLDILQSRQQARTPVQKTMPSGPLQVTGISGDYTVGVGKNFTSINAVITTLNFGAPVTGPTRFLLTDAAYSEAGFVLGTLTYGAGGPFTVTFQPAAGNTACSVTLTNNASGGGGWVMDSVSHVTIEGVVDGGTPGAACGGTAATRNLTITLSGSTSSSVIRIRDGSDHVTVADCNIVGAVGTTTGTIGVNMTTDSAPQSDLTVQNCRIHDQERGVASSGLFPVNDATAANSWDQRINVLGNDIGTAVARMGISLQQAKSCLVSCNSVHDVSLPATFASPGGTSRVAGIFLNNNILSTIAKNTVDNIVNGRTSGSGTGTRTYGIRADAKPLGLDDSWSLVFSNNRIINNCVTRVKGTTTSGTGFRDIGIESGGGRRDTLYYNTVIMTGSSSPGNDGSTCYQVFGNRGALFTGFTVVGGRSRVFNCNFVNDRDAGSGLVEHTAYRPFNDGGATDIQSNSDHNVLYSPGSDGETAPGYANVVAWRSTLADIHSLGYNPFVLSATDCHFDVTQPSSASNSGLPVGAVSEDIFGNPRSATTPDAGASEQTVNAPLYHDAFVSSLDAPSASGLPAGLPFSPILVTIGNSTPSAEASVTAEVKIFDPVGSLVYDHSASAGPLPGVGSVQVSIPNSYTPVTAGKDSVAIILTMAGDADASNNVLSTAFPVAGLKVPGAGYCSGFENAGELDGWFGDGDWAVGSILGGDTKLGGAHTGDKSYQTVPGPPGTQYNGGGVISNLYTPFFDLTGMADGYVSFYQNLATEPEWDRSVLQYTLDTGKTWSTLGVLDDPNGVNWYSSTVYQNAPGAMGTTCFDIATATAHNVLYFQRAGFWTSNGDCPSGHPDVTTGPFGFIYVQFRLPASILGHSYIRFRYSTFSDASGADDGWAIDDFCIKPTAPVFNGSIAGTKFLDVNGNGVKDAGDNGQSGIPIVLTYFGVAIKTHNTDANGNFLFDSLKPGSYGLVPTDPPGYAVTNGPVTVNNDGTQTLTAVNVGDYQGSVSGTKWDDLNKNGVKDVGEPGLLGWSVELHKDSCNGALLQTTTTGVGGAFSFGSTPGTYYLKEVLQPNWVQTFPAVNCSGAITVSGSSGSPTALVTGVNFGNFQLACIRVEKTVDLNGNGIKDAGDVTGMPAGAFAVLQVKKGAAVIFTDTLGNGNLVSITHCGLDVGTYSVQEVFASPQWIQTAGGNPSFVVSTSDTRDTARYLNFKLTSASGTKFNDLNGNGVKDAGEPGLAGWKINLSGTVLGGTSSITDANGNWSIDSVGGGAHVISEVNQSGWTQTLPTGGTYAFNGVSASVPGSIQTGKDFGNFLNFCISGVKYRDRNDNGTRQAGEEGLSGWQINVSGVGGGSVPTDASGNYSICNVGPGPHVVTETPQAGWLTTQPSGGNYTFNGASGLAVTGQDFGNFQASDSSYLYRTFTSDELEDAAQHKPVKPAKIGKPYVGPNIATLLKDYFKQFGNAGISVGLPGQLNAGGKEKAYVLPKGYTDVLKSLWVKGITHSTNIESTEVYRGFDFDTKGKQMLKRFKALPPTKQLNDCFEELLTLAANIAMSDAGKTPAGLRNLLYDDGISGASLNGLSVAAIKSYADNVMTNFEFQPLAVYARLELVASKINEAFSCGGVDCESVSPLTTADYDTASWIGTGKVQIRGKYPVTAISYLRANPGAEPKIIQVPRNVVPVPTVYTMYQNYPNPFNPTTTIEFDLPTDAFVTLKIYNIVGQEMGTLLNHEALDYGNQSVDFDASNLPSGVYFYRISAQSLNDDGVATGQVFKQVKKMMLVK